MKKAKAKIEAKDLDLDKPNELLVAIAIVVIVVGFLICAPECLPALLAVVSSWDISAGYRYDIKGSRIQL